MTRPIASPLYLFVAALGGITQGFVTVTLGFVLAGHGFSVAAIASLVALRILPDTWRVLFGPALDLSLNPRLWYLISAAGAALCLFLFGLLPLRQDQLLWFHVLTLAMGVFSALSVVAQVAAVAVTTESAQRGRTAGWGQAGNLGGMGLGGGLGLWLASHVGFAVSAFIVAATALACAWPMLLIRTPRDGAAQPLSIVLRGVGREVLVLASTRVGLLTMLAVTLPMGLGCFLGLLSSVSTQWGASADLTAWTTGVIAGLVTVPGCLIGGWFCSRRPPQIVLTLSGLVCAAGEGAMALGPRLPIAFVGFTLLNNLLLGVAYAAVAAVIYAALRAVGGGTIGALLGSLCNVPLVTVTFVLGLVSARHGTTGMLLLEAGLAAASALIYGAMAWLWRPRPLALDPLLAPV